MQLLEILDYMVSWGKKAVRFILYGANRMLTRQLINVLPRSQVFMVGWLMDFAVVMALAYLVYQVYPFFTGIKGLVNVCMFTLPGSAVWFAIGGLPAMRNTSEIHGTASWASEGELFKEGYLQSQPAGLTLGQSRARLPIYGPKYLTVPNETEWHAILIGGHGTGKTAGGIIPSVMNFPGSVFCLDIKGELYAKTSEIRRSSIGPVYRIKLGKMPTSSDGGDYLDYDLGNRDVWSYNPLARCGWSTDEGRSMAKRFAMGFIPEKPNDQNAWVVKGAQEIVTALAMVAGEGNHDIFWMCNKLLFEASDPVSMSAVLDFYDIPVVTAAGDVLRKAADDKVREYYLSEIRNVANNFLRSEELKEATSAVGLQFKPEDLEKPCTVYLQVPEPKIEQYRDLIRIIFLQVMNYLQTRPERKQPHIMMVADEFPQLGYIEQLKNMPAMLRSRNVHCLFACQSISQIDDAYREAVRNIILAITDVKAVYGADDYVGQKYFSELLGHKTVVTRGYSRNMHNGGSTNVQEAGVPLMYTNDFSNLKETARQRSRGQLGDVVLFLPGVNPYKAKKLYYYLDPIMGKVPVVRSWGMVPQEYANVVELAVKRPAL